MAEKRKPQRDGWGLESETGSVKNCLNTTTSPCLTQVFPRMNPRIRIRLQHYLSEIEDAPFVDREHNVILPELIIEILRIESEVAHGN